MEKNHPTVRWHLRPTNQLEKKETNERYNITGLFLSGRCRYVSFLHVLCGSNKSQYSGFCWLGLLSGFAAVFLLLQMGHEWRQRNKNNKRCSGIIATLATAGAAASNNNSNNNNSVGSSNNDNTNKNSNNIWHDNGKMAGNNRNDNDNNKWQKNEEMAKRQAVSTYFDGNSELAIWKKLMEAQRKTNIWKYVECNRSDSNHLLRTLTSLFWLLYIILYYIIAGFNCSIFHEGRPYTSQAPAVELELVGDIKGNVWPPNQ